eukprot:g24989.t1
MVVDHTRPIAYTDFINKELVQFAKYDVQRSVPSVVDGFKPSQRKVLFCAFKKRLRHDIKVAQFVGYISEHSAYHHGEVSLENTIVNLAQNFVGSNNTNFLVPSGQFGTRLQGGKDGGGETAVETDHAASRYIYTRLSPVTRVLFQQDDDHVLNYLEEEGLSIEPQWYCPTLPTVLVNGAEGIGVGWSTSIPNYNPRDIIRTTTSYRAKRPRCCRNIRKMLRGLPMEDMHPWYKGFMGSIEPSEKEDCRYEVTGVITKTSDTTVEITELPIKAWTQNYKEFLEECMAKDGKKGEESESLIEDFKEHHSESSVHFEITMSAAKLKEAEQAGLEKTFKLKSSLSTSNMVLFDAEGKIAKYNTALDILKEFCRLRRQMYQKRKDYLVAKLTRETEILSNKARFILMVVKGELEIRRTQRTTLRDDDTAQPMEPKNEDAIMKGKATVDEAAEAESNKDKETPDKTEYDYLLNMNLWSLTYEKELEKLKATTIEMLWDKDLEAVCAALDELERQEDDELMAAAEATQGRQAVERSKAPAKRTRKAEAEKAPPPRAVAGAAIPPEVVHRRRQAAAEKSKDTFLKKPLSTVDKTEFVQKQVWGANGTGPVKSKKTDTPPAPVGMTAEKAPAAPKRKAAAVQMQPLQDISDLSGASLLSRLLNKSGPTGSSTSSSFDARPLESSDGLFSYLSTEPSTSDMVDLDPVSVDLTGRRNGWIGDDLGWVLVGKCGWDQCDCWKTHEYNVRNQKKRVKKHNSLARGNCK